MSVRSDVDLLGENWSRLRAALYPLARAPSHAAWNQAEIADLLADCDTRMPAAVLVGLVPRPEGVRVLLTVRHAALRHHGGQISFPGGRIESDDADPVAAAVREAGEEIGLVPRDIAPLGYLDPFVTVTGFHVWPVVARVATDHVARIDPNEVDELFEVPLGFLLDAANARAVAAEWRGRRRHLIEFNWGPYRIWGATAAMLVNLRTRLEGRSDGE
ncbi:NUDIX hydrolase [Coralloluteibacterium stylophorae]|uniref:CoA pyrophosphatase n=1 Tax=Coralloluteibacterium stylophorae TaxID=1776034 RepID=A0A8J7VYF4_9GAMM